jgi:hypothetical protein
MTTFLYKNFLEDKRVYHLNVAYWKRYFRKLLKDREDVVFDWMNTRFGNGASFYDGNPMITVLLKKDRKAIRIIQEEPETDGVEIGAWMGEVEVEGTCYKELVISLELSKKANQVAQALISRWIENNALGDPVHSMESFIDQTLANFI